MERHEQRDHSHSTQSDEEGITPGGIELQPLRYVTTATFYELTRNFIGYNKADEPSIVIASPTAVIVLGLDTKAYRQVPKTYGVLGYSPGLFYKKSKKKYKVIQ